MEKLREELRKHLESVPGMTNYFILVLVIAANYIHNDTSPAQIISTLSRFMVLPNFLAWGFTVLLHQVRKNPEIYLQKEHSAPSQNDDVGRINRGEPLTGEVLLSPQEKEIQNTFIVIFDVPQDELRNTLADIDQLFPDTNLSQDVEVAISPPSSVNKVFIPTNPLLPANTSIHFLCPVAYFPPGELLSRIDLQKSELRSLFAKVNHRFQKDVHCPAIEINAIEVSVTGQNLGLVRKNETTPDASSDAFSITDNYIDFVLFQELKINKTSPRYTHYKKIIKLYKDHTALEIAGMLGLTHGVIRNYIWNIRTFAKNGEKLLPNKRGEKQG